MFKRKPTWVIGLLTAITLFPAIAFTSRTQADNLSIDYVKDRVNLERTRPPNPSLEKIPVTHGEDLYNRHYVFKNYIVARSQKDHQLYLVEGKSGKRRLLGGQYLDFIESNGHTAFFSKVVKEHTYKEIIDYMGEPIALDLPHTSRQLLTLTNSDHTLKAFNDLPFEDILFSDKNNFWVTGNARPCSIWRISKTSQEIQKFAELSIQVVPNLTSCSVSPDRNHLALDTMRFKNEPHVPEVDLLIFNLASGRLERRISTINIEVSVFSSHLPQLKMKWHGNNGIRFSETVLKKGLNEGVTLNELADRRGYHQWSEIDLQTGKRCNVHPYSKCLLLEHEAPPATKNVSIPNCD